MIEKLALAAWMDYCGVPLVREDWMSDDDWHDELAPVRQWHEEPKSCTHIGADGFKSCVRAVLQALMEPTPEMVEAGKGAYVSMGDYKVDSKECWKLMILAAMRSA